MKKYLPFLILFLIFGCSSSKVVYWCGDHPCINKKEKKSYFKKTMIIEVRELGKDSNNNSEIEKLLQQTRINEKRRIYFLSSGRFR